MADTAERVVVRLEAQVDKYVADVAKASTATESSLSKVERAAAGAEAQMARSAANMGGAVRQAANDIDEGARRSANATRNLGRQVSDIGVGLATGQNPFFILAQQAPQVADALADTGGRAATVAAFFAGPWGASLLAAGTAASVLLGEILKTDDALGDETAKLEANAVKTATAEQAKAAFARTEAGLIDDVRQLTQELNEQNRALQTNAEQLNIRAKTDLEGLQQKRQRQAREVTAARDDVAAARVAEAGGAEGALSSALGKLTAAEAKLKTLDRSIADAQAAVQRSRAELAAEAAGRATDETSAINFKYDGANGLIEQAKKRAIAEGLVTAELTRQLATLERQRKAELKAAQAREKPDASNRQFGREITTAEARRIAEGIGGRVTSGDRTREEQQRIKDRQRAGLHVGPVAEPGTSAHERGGAIDIAFGKGITVATIKAAFAEAGVALRKVLREPTQGVYHVEFGKAGRSGPSAETLARRRAAEADEQLQNRSASVQDLARLDAEILGLKRQEATSIEEIARLAAEQVEKQRDRELEAQDTLEARKKRTGPEAEAARLRIKEVAKLRIDAINLDKSVALGAQSLDSRRAELRNQEDLAQAAGQLAERSDQRRAIDLKLLELKYEELRLEQEAIRDRQGASKEQKDLAKRRLEVLRELETADRAGLEQRNRGAYENYRRGLAGEFETIQETVDNIQIDALRSLEDTLVDSAKAALGLSGALGNVVEQLIRVGIQRRLIGPIADGLFGKADGSGGGGFFGKLLKTVVTSFGGKGKKDFNAGATLGSFASGGSLTIAGSPGVDQNLLSINGAPLARVSRGERLDIVPQTAMARGGASGGTVRIIIEEADGLMARVRTEAQGVAVETIRVAAPTIVKASVNATMAEAGRPRLG